MGTLVPDQNYDHLLIPVSGYDGMHDLQFAAKFKDGEVFERGALISLDSNGEFVAGLDSQTAMPMWAINATGDFDVNSDVGNVSATGIVGAYPGTCGMELRTTEFDAGAAPYSPNDLLAGDGVTAGYVTKAAASNYNDNAVVGCVSTGVQTENYDQDTLGFWAMFIPAVDIT